MVSPPIAAKSAAGVPGTQDAIRLSPERASLCSGTPAVMACGGGAHSGWRMAAGASLPPPFGASEGPPATERKLPTAETSVAPAPRPFRHPPLPAARAPGEPQAREDTWKVDVHGARVGTPELVVRREVGKWINHSLNP